MLEVRYDGDGLHALINGKTYLNGVPLPSWAPTPRWSIGFGAYSECKSEDFWGVDNVDLLDWKLERGSHVWPAETRLQVSLNGQQIDVDTLSMRRIHAAQVSDVMPSSGPVVGGSQVTLTGANLGLGDDYRCRFGTVVVPATSVDRYTIKCVSPLNCAGRLSMQASLNGQQFAPGVAFQYFGGAACTDTAGAAAPIDPSGDASGGTQVQVLSPSSGPGIGQTRIEITGRAFDFGSMYVCEFNSTQVEASYVSSTMVTCVTPPSGGGNAEDEATRLCACL